MPKYVIAIDAESRTSISKGNIKIGGTANFSTLPSNEILKNKAGEELCNVAGTCGKYCECCKHDCYAVRSAKLHHNSVIPAWAKNTLLVRENPKRVYEDIVAFVQKYKCEYFRFHTSGALENVAHLKLYADICNACPTCNFHIYTKEFDVIVGYLREGYKMPENLIVNLSEWKGNIDEFLQENKIDNEIKAVFDSFNVFSYDDKTPECMAQKVKMVHCPAVLPNGHESGVTCDKCRRCFRRGFKTAVYSH